VGGAGGCGVVADRSNPADHECRTHLWHVSRHCLNHPVRLLRQLARRCQDQHLARAAHLSSQKREGYRTHTHTHTHIHTYIHTHTPEAQSARAAAAPEPARQRRRSCLCPTWPAPPRLPPTGTLSLSERAGGEGRGPWRAAAPKPSLPSGMTRRWIGLGTRYPASVSARSTAGRSSSCANDVGPAAAAATAPVPADAAADPGESAAAAASATSSVRGRARRCAINSQRARPCSL
jgi:hypothetical protein